MKKTLLLVLVFAGMTILWGCAAPEKLAPKGNAVPSGLDLSGQWRLRPASQETQRRIDAAERRVTGGDESLIPTSRQKRSRRVSDDIQVHVFLETGKALKLTQTDHGLFVSFDRSVVEEYRFGEQRIVNVGPVEAERVSGWEGSTYVIETRGKEGAMLVESYRLDGDSLIRSVRITNGDEVVLDVEQLFDRA